MNTNNKKWFRVPSVVGIMLALDLVSKFIADEVVDPYEPIEVLPFFNLVNLENKGAAFGMFAGLGNGFFITVSVCAILFIVHLLINTKECPFCLALILSGALGNLYDRLAYGEVRDFLDFHIAGKHWPAFNVADSALTVGLALLFVDAFIQLRRHERENK